MTRTSPSTPLSAAIQQVFGMAAPALGDARGLQWAALEHRRGVWNHDESSAAHYVSRYLDRTDVFLRAMATSPLDPICSDVFHMLLDVVLAAVPFRHEVFVVEVRGPHRLWGYDEGWYLATEALFEERPAPAFEHTPDPDVDAFGARLRHASWLFHLFPKHDDTAGVPGFRARARADSAAHGWRAAGRPEARELVAALDASDGTGAADALVALWGSFFLGEYDVSLSLRARLATHASAAVRSSVDLLDAVAVEAGSVGGVDVMSVSLRRTQDAFTQARHRRP